MLQALYKSRPTADGIADTIQKHGQDNILVAGALLGARGEANESIYRHNRLVHGQIISTWMPHLRSKIFVIVNDQVPTNDLQMAMPRRFPTISNLKPVQSRQYLYSTTYARAHVCARAVRDSRGRRSALCEAIVFNA